MTNVIHKSFYYNKYYISRLLKNKTIQRNGNFPTHIDNARALKRNLCSITNAIRLVFLVSISGRAAGFTFERP